jgi:glycine cleavage system H protein
VELPKPGQNVEKEKPCAVVESVKAAFDIYAPVSGKITALNEEVSKEPALINQSPMEKAWLFKIQMSDPGQISSLMDWNAYQEFVKQSAH